METINNDINLLGASGRAKGVANFAVNFEPGGQSPLDARLLVKTKEDLINPETYSAKNYYKGMSVTVESDGTEYVLMDISKITSEDYSGWKQRDPMDTLESLPSTLITDLTNITFTGNNATIHSSKITKEGRTYKSVTDDTITISAATTTAAGVMTSTDKTELDRITTANFALGAVTPNASTVAIAATKTTISTGASANNNITLPSATSSLAGVMTAADKVKLDTTLPNQISAETSRATAREEELDNKIDTTKSDILGTASESGNTLGELEDRLEAEVSRATTKENQLQSSIDSSKGTIDNYTVNGIKISTNPVITGANAKVTGYSKPTSTSAIAATDSINAALGKLEKKADDHIANKSNPHGVTKAQVGLGNVDNTSDIDKPISTATQTALNSKVQTVEVTGTGNAITTASISGTKLTLTKGATYNNYSHPVGASASKTSGFYKFSTDSTSHISSVTSVTKKDITGLGIPSTNTTYSFTGGNGSFTVTPSGGSAQSVSIGKPSTAGTADTAKACTGNSATASKVNNNLVIKVNSGTTEGTNLYTFNGSTAKTLDIKSGSNVTLTPAAGSLTISATDTKYSAGTNISLSGTTFSLASTISLTRVNASEGFFQTSDKRLKSNIKPLDHSLEDICSIPTDSFILNGKNDFGTIAQEVEDKFPELVSEARLKESDVDEPSKFDKVEINGESYVLVKEVDYSKLSILAIEGIKLLKKEIEELKKQLNK